MTRERWKSHWSSIARQKSRSVEIIIIFFLECTVNVLYAIYLYFLLMISCPLTISKKIIYDAIIHKTHRNKFSKRHDVWKQLKWWSMLQNCILFAWRQVDLAISTIIFLNITKKMIIKSPHNLQNLELSLARATCHQTMLLAWRNISRVCGEIWNSVILCYYTQTLAVKTLYLFLEKKNAFHNAQTHTHTLGCIATSQRW